MSTSVNAFLEKLASQQPQAKKEQFKNTRSLEKIYLNYPGNFGRYQLWPINSVVTDYPYITLFNTREINIPRKNVTSEGTENVYNAWVKLLPKSAYQMKDQATGRIISSLTAAEEQQLNQAYILYDQLREELDARNNREEHVTKLIRTRNYTIFFGHCINKWDSTKGGDSARVPSRQNFSALFVCTAKNFINSVSSSIEDTATMEGGDHSWLPGIYNRELLDANRNGFLLFTINNNPNQAGYLVTASHKIGRTSSTTGAEIKPDDAELMLDPISSFLGWQANRESDEVPVDQRRLYNSALIEESILYMSQQLSAIRMAKQSSMSVADAITATVATALSGSVQTPNVSTNDPMLAEMVNSAPEGNNVAQMFSANTEPFTTPPAAHIDPLNSSPISPSNQESFGFEKPSFATGNFGSAPSTAFASDSAPDDLPF